MRHARVLLLNLTNNSFTQVTGTRRRTRNRANCSPCFTRWSAYRWAWSCSRASANSWTSSRPWWSDRRKGRWDASAPKPPRSISYSSCPSCPAWPLRAARPRFPATRAGRTLTRSTIASSRSPPSGKSPTSSQTLSQSPYVDALIEPLPYPSWNN